MTAKNYSRLAALIFAIVAVLQLARAVSGLPVTVGTTISIPLWASWIACVRHAFDDPPNLHHTLANDQAAQQFRVQSLGTQNCEAA